ncbi:MAG: hypothetical protein ACI92E_001682, partial [Oceanicoccus sp.]
VVRNWSFLGTAANTNRGALREDMSFCLNDMSVTGTRVVISLL